MDGQTSDGDEQTPRGFLTTRRLRDKVLTLERHRARIQKDGQVAVLNSALKPSRRHGRLEDEAMSNEDFPPPGRYRHHKGNDYTVLGTARHSETMEELVVYRQEYGDRELWVRPKAMFSESVTVDGQQVPRFQQMASSGEAVGEGVSNIFADLPQQLPRELVQILIRAHDVRIERILSHGHASPPDFWYDQPQHEWVIVLQGSARLQFENHSQDMNPGDFINIPAFQKHRVDWTTPDEPTVWLGVRYGHTAESTPDSDAGS